MNCLGFHLIRLALHLFQLGRTATDEVFVIPCPFIDTSWYSVVRYRKKYSVLDLYIMKIHMMWYRRIKEILTFQIPKVATAYRMI